MSDALSFVDALVNGHATVDEYDDYVEQWHDAPDDGSAVPLHEFLGLTWAEYQVVARDEGAFRFVAAARRQGIELLQLMEHKGQYGLAARSQDLDSAKQVIDLLTAAGIYPPSK
ncbi:hypothetical protein NHF46_12780 [Arthrobacter alpinus]|nr:hypothetical protein [Arthrobacter alpinus]